MFLKTHKRISDLMDTVSEMVNILYKFSNSLDGINDCLGAFDAILSQLTQEELVPKRTIEQLKSLQLAFYAIIENPTMLNEQYSKVLNDEVIVLKTIYYDEVKAKLNVVFFPYKASMWDSLATVYEAAAKDKDCVVKVVPIPYYQLSQNKDVLTYEGNKFPSSVPITNYNKYDLALEEPDVIFVHNIYDQYNTITRVDEEFFTSNLKKYTNMLVYVPYHISSYIPPKKGDHCAAYCLPSVHNVDKIILVGEFLKEAAIRDGLPAEKLLALGSPKLDAMVNALKGEIAYPSEWDGKLNGKTVYVLNTGCMYFAANPFVGTHRFTEFLCIPKFLPNSVLIWRPHPLTEASILRYVPQLYEGYLNIKKLIKDEHHLYKNIILDETDDYLPALKVADVLISADGSLLRSYLLTEKKVLFWGDEPQKNSLLPPDAFYYAHGHAQQWHDIVKMFAEGHDPLAKNRKGMAARVYANTDGTCGEKVYNSIKDCVLNS